jgi:hypothetical protein
MCCPNPQEAGSGTMQHVLSKSAGGRQRHNAACVVRIRRRPAAAQCSMCCPNPQEAGSGTMQHVLSESAGGRQRHNAACVVRIRRRPAAAQCSMCCPNPQEAGSGTMQHALSESAGGRQRHNAACMHHTGETPHVECTHRVFGEQTGYAGAHCFGGCVLASAETAGHLVPRQPPAACHTGTTRVMTCKHGAQARVRAGKRDVHAGVMWTSRLLPLPRRWVCTMGSGWPGPCQVHALPLWQQVMVA